MICFLLFAIDVAACCVLWRGEAVVMRLGCWLSGLSIRCQSLMRCADGSGYSSTVDIFNAGSGQWTTAALSVARVYLAATSLPNHGLAIFAGGGGL